MYEIGRSMTEKEWQKAKTDAELDLAEANAILAEGRSMKKEAHALLTEARALTDTASAAEKKAQAAEKDAQARQKMVLGDRKKKDARDKLDKLNEQDPHFASHYVPDFELAVGYDFLSVDRTTIDPRAGSYEISGSIQTLPSISLYASWDLPPWPEWPDTPRRKHWSRLLPGFAYFGLGTGHIVFKNATVIDANGGHYSFASDPDSWPASSSLGLGWHIMRRSDSQSGLTAFIEYSYEVRNFQSGIYKYSAPAQNPVDLSSILPRNLKFSGFVANVGFELKFPKIPKSPKP